MIDDKTVHRNYSLPNPNNLLEEDVIRIKDSFEQIDIDVDDLYSTTTQFIQTAQSGSFWYGLSTGAGSAYEVTLTPVPLTLNEGMIIRMQAHVQNTGPSSINVNSLGIKNIKRTDGSDLRQGDIPQNALVTLIYDGISFQLINTPTDSKTEAINTSNIMRVFEEIQENHGGALLMEAGWSDSFAIPNEQGADEINSTGLLHDPANKLYKGTEPETAANSDKSYNLETNYLQQEWTNSTQGTSQATFTNGSTQVTLSTGNFPSNCDYGRIKSADDVFYNIAAGQGTSTLTLSESFSGTTGDSDYAIYLSNFKSGEVELNALTEEYTSLLLHLDGTDGSTSIPDSSGLGHTVSVIGNAQIDTSQSKFGGSSVQFDGSGDGLNVTGSDSFAFGTDDFTIDLWYRPIAGSDTFLADYSNYSLRFWISGGRLKLNSGDVPFNPSLNAWNHIAVSRSGTDLRFFLNGSQIGTTQTNSDNIIGPSNFSIGKEVSSGNFDFNGHIDEFRISKGIARWTANFTPPTQPYIGQQSPANEYVSICDTETEKTNCVSWTNVNSSSSIETINSQNIYYWLAFDPSPGYANGTEIKIFNTTGNIWRKIAQNTSGTWQYNNDPTDTINESWANASINNMLHAISQAISAQASNRMTGANLAAITNIQWEETGGWDSSLNSLIRGITLYSNNASQKPSVSLFRLNYDAERGAVDLKSKTYDPNFIPSEAYVWSRIEHSDSDGPGTFYVSRNGGTEWTAVSMEQQGLPLSGDIRIIRGTVDLTGQTSGQDLRCRFETEQGKDQFIHSWGLQAKS